MKINKITDLLEYNSLIEKYSSIKLYSNDYLQAEAERFILDGVLYEYHTERNLFLFLKKEIGYRVYYYIGSENEIIDISALNNLVIEILYRGDKFYPKAEIDYLHRCGFSINLIRDQYCGVYKDLIKYQCPDAIKIEKAQRFEDVVFACELFNNTFDKLSGDYISLEHYNDLYKKNQILVAKDVEGNYLGALHYAMDKSVAWVRHLVVLPSARGKRVGQCLFSVYIENNFTSEGQRYMFWVQQQNDVAINMYKKMGFKYLNKSTISMIKI